MLFDTSTNSVSTLSEVEWVDTHAHLNFKDYKKDCEEVIKRTLDNDVWMINVGSQYETSKRAVEIAEKHSEGVFAATGLHPIHSQDEFDYEKYKELAVSKKVVAIGEIGLDYKPEYISFKERQKEVFLKQIELAKELKLPIIFHCRLAHNDLISILNTEYNIQNTNLGGVIHCFTGNWEEAKKYLEMGFHLGFNGIIFRLNLDEVIEKTPLDKILIETDCPYLIPPLPAEALAKEGPLTGRNEPIYVKYVAEKIAKIKKINYEEIEEQTTKNAKTLFSI
jgi:TatD DNase family protein